MIKDAEHPKLVRAIIVTKSRGGGVCADPNGGSTAAAGRITYASRLWNGLAAHSGLDREVLESYFFGSEEIPNVFSRVVQEFTLNEFLRRAVVAGAVRLPDGLGPDDVELGIDVHEDEHVLKYEVMLRRADRDRAQDQPW